MKKIFLTLAIIFASFTTLTMNAADCGQEVNKACLIFNTLNDRMQQVQTLEEFQNIDFDALLNGLDSTEFSDECNDYVLTAEDKENLQKSFNAIFDSMTDKMVQLTYGMVPREQITAQIAPMISMHNKLLEDSVTFGEYTDGFAQFGQMN